jgi:hypothetical protein
MYREDTHMFFPSELSCLLDNVEEYYIARQAQMTNGAPSLRAECIRLKYKLNI